MATIVLPLTKAIYLCDEVVEDRSSHKTHLLGIFNAIRPADAMYPYRFRQLCVFAQLVGGLREAPVHLEIANARTGTIIYTMPQQRLQFPGRRTTINACFRIRNCVFPEAGVYVIQLYAYGIFLEDRVLHLLAPEEIES